MSQMGTLEGGGSGIQDLAVQSSNNAQAAIKSQAGSGKQTAENLALGAGGGVAAGSDTAEISAEAQAALANTKEGGTTVSGA